MYKLTILFFFLTAFSSQGLMDVYQLKFENKDATYTLQVNNGSLVFENQPDVTVVEYGNAAVDNEQSASGKIYKIMPNATWQEGLKIGGMDIENYSQIGTEIIDDVTRIGAEIIDDYSRIGAVIIEDYSRIGAEIIGDYSRIKEIASFKTEDYDACEIKLGYELIIIKENSINTEQKIEISENGFYIYIIENELILFE